MSSARRFLSFWLLLTALALFVNLGSAPLFDADEGRNAEVGREMASTHDYVMPRIDGMPYLDKPIVYYAAEAAAMEVLGPTELAARLPACLFTLLTAAVVFWFARRIAGESEAYVAAIVFLTIPFAVAFARTVIFDSALTFFMVVAIVAFHSAIEASAASDVRRARTSTAIAWGSIALGVLTKGPVAILVPLLVAIPYAIRRRRLRALGSIAGFVLFAAIITPWVWAVSRIVPDFLHYVLVTETAQRLATKALKRTGPPWYFIPYLIGGALPWSIVAFGAWTLDPLSADRRNNRFFLLCWIGLPLLFFSLSQSKRPQYILPVMPAIALLVAQSWSGTSKNRAAIRVAAVVLLVLGIVILCAPFVHAKMAPEIAAGIRSMAIPTGIVIVTASLAAWFLEERRDLALAALTLPVIALPLLAAPLMDAIAVRRSAKSFVAALGQRAGSARTIAGIQDYTGSMQFYLRRRIVVVTPDAEEFTSNYIIRHYDAFAGEVTSPVRRPGSEPGGDDTLFIVRANDQRAAQTLQGRGFVAVARDPRHVAYARTATMQPARR